MSSARARLLQEDLFGRPSLVGTVARSPASKPDAQPVVRAKRRKVAETQVEGHRRAKLREGSVRWKLWQEIKGAWFRGWTRQELAARTGEELWTVCGAVGWLLANEYIFEPVVGYAKKGTPIHWQRDKHKVLVDRLYLLTWDLRSVTEPLL